MIELPVSLDQRWLHPDLRHVRTALEGIDIDALGRTERDELSRWLGIAQRAVGEVSIMWRRVKNRPCPRILAGLRCHAPEECICRRYVGLIDHWATSKSGGVLRLTSELYEADGGPVAEFILECRELGLDVRLTGASPYSPEAFVIDIRGGGHGGVDL